jgi:hypothetical protein
MILMRMGKNVNRAIINKLGPKNIHPIREVPSRRCPNLNSGSKALKTSASNLMKAVDNIFTIIQIKKPAS